MEKIKGTIAFILAATFIVSCGNSNGSAWRANVPGEYLGNAPGFREIIRLKPDGKFDHEVFIDGKYPLKESGSWKFDDGGSAIRVDGFSRFFDTWSHKLTNEPQRDLAYGVLFAWPDGKRLNVISTDVDFRYYLFRTQGGAASTPTNALPAANVTNKGVGD